MDFFRKLQVTKVPRGDAKAAGCQVITTKWIDVNKGDEARPNYRSRFVGRELNLSKRLDLFAATPPLEALEAICSICVSNQQMGRSYRILAVDVKRAYVYGKAQRPVFIEIPIEDWAPGGEQLVGKLNLSLYGTRDAAMNWTREYTEFLEPIWVQSRKSVAV